MKIKRGGEYFPVYSIMDQCLLKAWKKLQIKNGKEVKMSEKSWSLSYIVRSYINLQSWSLAAKGYRLVIICKVTIDKEQGQRELYMYYI